MSDETIFATALEKADPAERAAFLAEACGDDAARRQRLEGLLRAHAGAADFLERLPVAAHAPAPGAPESLSGPRAPVEAAPRTAGGDDGPPAQLTRNTAAVPTDRTPGESRAYPQIPGYEILGICGHGGMGVV